MSKINKLDVYFNRNHKKIVRTDPPGFEDLFKIVIGEDGQALMSGDRIIQRIDDLVVVSVQGMYETSAE